MVEKLWETMQFGCFFLTADSGGNSWCPWIRGILLVAGNWLLSCFYAFDSIFVIKRLLLYILIINLSKRLYQRLVIFLAAGELASAAASSNVATTSFRTSTPSSSTYGDSADDMSIMMTMLWKISTPPISSTSSSTPVSFSSTSLATTLGSTCPNKIFCG